MTDRTTDTRMSRLLTAAKSANCVVLTEAEAKAILGADRYVKNTMARNAAFTAAWQKLKTMTAALS